MLAVRITCPFCEKTFRRPQDAPAGRRLRCPGCERTFAPPVEAPSSAAPDWAVQPPAPAPASPDEEPAAPSLQRPLLLAGIGGGLLVLVVATVVVLVMAARADKRRRDTVIVKDDPPKSPREDPPQPIRPVVADDPRPVERPPPPPVELTLPTEVQSRVNEAIRRGVAYLKDHQLPSGAWEKTHETGLAALPALALLECGVPATDERIQKAAKLVRETAAKLTENPATYEVSLALLFLDKLGDAKDEPLIRSLAMRLVAGQCSDGSWWYTLPELSAEEETQLIDFLGKARQPFDVVAKPVKSKADTPVVRAGERLERNDKSGDGPSKRLDTEEAKAEQGRLSKRLRNIPAVGDAADNLATNQLSNNIGDNSNTQFATLALWAARRHGLPLERSLALLAKRFDKTQASNGSWGYFMPQSGGSPAMTGAGLLGLAVGHGVSTDPRRKSTVTDKRINRGLRALGEHVGKQLDAPNKPETGVNIFLLWTVERVGVLYNVRQIGGKDWYRWGVDQLLPLQEKDGGWHQGNHYHIDSKCVDTCFALLFLKRSNLAFDLTHRLEFMVEGKPTR